MGGAERQDGVGHRQQRVQVERTLFPMADLGGGARLVGLDQAAELPGEDVAAGDRRRNLHTRLHGDCSLPRFLCGPSGPRAIVQQPIAQCPDRARPRRRPAWRAGLSRVPKPQKTDAARAGHQRSASPLVQRARPNCTRQGKSTLGPLQRDRARWRTGAGKRNAGREVYPQPHRHRYAARAYNRRKLRCGPTPPRSDRGWPRETASPRNA